MTHLRQPKPAATHGKPDPRVRRTRRSLRESLISLILEKDYDQITIQDITDRADLSRATFYLHYADKDELLASSLRKLSDEMLDASDMVPEPGTLRINGHPPSTLIFKHVQRYAQFYKALLLGSRDFHSVIYTEIHYLSRIAELQIRGLIGPDNEPLVPLPLLAQSVAGSIFATMIWWLEKDMPHSPEQMGEYIHSIIAPGVLASLQSQVYSHHNQLALSGD